MLVGRLYTHGGTILIHKLDLGFGFALVYLFIASGIFCGEGVVNTKINTHTPNQPNPFRERNVVSVAVLIIETHVLALSWPSAKIIKYHSDNTLWGDMPQPQFTNGKGNKWFSKTFRHLY